MEIEGISARGTASQDFEAKNSWRTVFDAFANLFLTRFEMYSSSRVTRVGTPTFVMEGRSGGTFLLPVRARILNAIDRSASVHLQERDSRIPSRMLSCAASRRLRSAISFSSARMRKASSLRSFGVISQIFCRVENSGGPQCRQAAATLATAMELCQRNPRAEGFGLDRYRALLSRNANRLGLRTRPRITLHFGIPSSRRLFYRSCSIGRNRI